MHFSHYFPTIDTHTLGEPTRIVTGGLPPISGRTMLEKRAYMLENLDHVRTTLMNEPRGHHNMFGAVLTERTSDGAAFGLIFMDGDGYLNMCGHSTIGAVTVAVETGIIPITRPYTRIAIDVPIGLVEAAAKIDEEDRIEHVSIKSIPSFIYKRGVEIKTAGHGPVRVDIGFGGSFVALVDNNILGIDISRENAAEIVDLGMEIIAELNKILQVEHPRFGHIGSVEIINIYQKQPGEHLAYKNVGVFGHAQLDRSPCGTGICAIMADFHDLGAMRGNDELVLESVIGTRFYGRVIEETQVGPYCGIIPELRANAYITGFNQAVIDPGDPVKFGFRLG